MRRLRPDGVWRIKIVLRRSACTDFISIYELTGIVSSSQLGAEPGDDDI